MANILNHTCHIPSTSNFADVKVRNKFNDALNMLVKEHCFSSVVCREYKNRRNNEFIEFTAWFELDESMETIMNAVSASSMVCWSCILECSKTGDHKMTLNINTPHWRIFNAPDQVDVVSGDFHEITEAILINNNKYIEAAKKEYVKYTNQINTASLEYMSLNEDVIKLFREEGFNVKNKAYTNITEQLQECDTADLYFEFIEADLEETEIIQIEIDRDTEASYPVRILNNDNNDGHSNFMGLLLNQYTRTEIEPEWEGEDRYESQDYARFKSVEDMMTFLRHYAKMLKHFIGSTNELKKIIPFSFIDND